MAAAVEPLRILFASPAYWPATAFGGPIWMARELNEGLVRRGHSVEVMTTSLVDVRGGLTRRTRRADVAGVGVTYLATPLHYRWMGITPTLPVWLARTPRPDVAHVFGFRDVVTTLVAGWCRRRGIPYVFEPLGMFRPRLRKVRFKQAFDATVARGVADGAALVVVTSEHERGEIAACGVDPDRVVIRGNGFPPPRPRADGDRPLRKALGLDSEPVVLYVGRLAAGKGIELLLDAARALPDVHVALVGPDDGHGTAERVAAAETDPATAGRIHRLGAVARPLDLYGDADVFVLASAGESFGMVAAEAASVGTPVIVSDRCGVAEFLGEDGAVVVPYDGRAVTEAIGRVLRDDALRERLSAGALAAAAANSWDVVVERQEQLYRRALDR